MNVDIVVDIVREALFLVLKTAAPPLIVSLVIGLLVSVFQTVTSIQEQTLTFVPKMVGMFLTLMLIGHWMLNGMTTFMEELWRNFSLYIR
ncbi:MAG: flagellar biosynthesis protein FliQ [Lachnospiraceae bacterium]|nr:flagellar biosynthesis protein FliQ [Lachnospiraceae bacterium]